MKTIKPAEINRTIAELITPFHQMEEYKTDGWQFDRYKSWQPIDFLRDPRGTCLLLQSLLDKGIEVLLLHRGDGLTSIDMEQGLEYLGCISQTNLSMAVVYAFLKAHDIEVQD